MDSKARRRPALPVTDPKLSRRPDPSKKVNQVSKSAPTQKKSAGLVPSSSSGQKTSPPLEEMLKFKLISFRKNLDMAPQNTSMTLTELLTGTLKDLQSKYHISVSYTGISNISCKSGHQALLQFYKVLKYVGELWAESCDQTETFTFAKEADLESLTRTQLGERVLDGLDRTSIRAKQMFELVEKKPVKTDNLYVPPLLRPLQLHTVENFKSGDGKRFAVHMVPVVVDHDSYPTDGSDTIDFLDALMAEDNTMLQLKKSLLRSTSVKLSDHVSETCKAAVPASPPSLPMLRLRASLLQSATPTPPPSPMAPRGLYMSMDPFAYAMTVDDIDTDTVSSPSQKVPPPPPPTAEIFKPVPPPPPAAQISKPPPPLPPSRLAPAPPPPPPQKGSAPSAPLPPLVTQVGPGPPPPPPSAAMRALCAKNTKLKRSSEMGNLYRLLKGKVEGSSLTGKACQQSKRQAGDGKGQGMADALAEITKRSAYFRQIEEDVEKYSASILELKSALGTFRTKEMSELTKFHLHVEQQLEKLSDETQVLARFEDFPYKKLETIRMAVALYLKLDTIAATLRSWNPTTPVARHLDKVESYFNKIKEEVHAADRNKDEESKRFQSHNIEFDFSVLIRIKESMVDLSSNCIEIALKVRSISP